MTSDQERQRADKFFKQEGSARDDRSEYEARALAIREKTASLKALRLAKEAQAQSSKRDK
jgi:hypothetical protein